jgi:hypothetical protein
MPLSFAPKLTLNLAERQQIISNQDEKNDQWQLMLSGQYIHMSVNGALKIGSVVSTVINQ